MGYYNRQIGGNLKDIGYVYRSPRYIQRGGSLGSLLSKIYSSLRPLIKSGFTALKDTAMKTAGGALTDIVSGKDIGQVFRDRSGGAIDDLSTKAKNKLRRVLDQTGSGRKRRRKHNIIGKGVVKKRRRKPMKKKTTARKSIKSSKIKSIKTIRSRFGRTGASKSRQIGGKKKKRSTHCGKVKKNRKVKRRVKVPKLLAGDTDIFS